MYDENTVFVHFTRIRLQTHSTSKVPSYASVRHLDQLGPTPHWPTRLLVHITHSMMPEFLTWNSSWLGLTCSTSKYIQIKVYSNWLKTARPTSFSKFHWTLLWPWCLWCGVARRCSESVRGGPWYRSLWRSMPRCAGKAKATFTENDSAIGWSCP